MSVIVKMRKQKAVWWKRRTTPDSFGVFPYEEPEEISCRWDDVVLSFVDPRGEAQSSQAVVYPDRVLSLGDKLQRGELDSNSSITDAFEVKRFDRTPNFKATETLFTAYL